MDRIKAFIELASIFKKNGYHLYLVGGTVRDYLLNRPLDDMDATSEATPFNIISFLENVDTTFARLGSLKYKDPNGIKFDITTLRKESAYLDSRHPSQITFVKDIKEDYLRRDFTINALYMDDSLKVIDYVNGINDLKNHTLRMIGDPFIRLKEDPLRIIRAIRFALSFNLKIEDNLFKAMKENFALLNNLTPAKIKSELNKIKEEEIDKEYQEELLKHFDIAPLLTMIK